MVVEMVEWYAIKIDPHNSTMCTLLYKRLRDGLCCEGLAGGSLYGLVRNNNVSKTITEAYVQIVKDSRGWRYVGLYAYESSLQYQTLVLTANEFYSRFLQHTVTL
jgi:hypothetical protein